MSNVENEVVSLTFNSGDFQRGVSEVLASLDDLRASLDFSTAQSTFAGIQGDADRFNLNSMESAIDNINDKFSALGAIAFTALQSVTNSAIDVAKGIFNNTLGQILTGGRERSLAIEQAKFTFRGLGLDVERVMQNATDAVTGTAYGLDEAASLAAQFGAGGIQAGSDMTGALRAVAGAASLVGGSYRDIGQIFADVAAKGALRGEHLFSFESRNLGVAKALAKQMGVTEETIRSMAANGEISFAQFSTAMNEAWGEHATTANETYAGSLANVRAAMNRLGEVFLAPKLEATRTVFNVLAPAIDTVKNALLPLVDLWRRFVNIQASKTINFIEGLDFTTLERLVPTIGKIFKNLYSAIGSFITPIKEAFREIFPKKSSDDLNRIAQSIRRFTKNLALSEETASKVKRIFAGFFAVISIGFAIIKGVIGLIGDIIGHLSGVGGGFLSAQALVGDFWVALKRILVDGEGISNFFDGLGDKIGVFIDAMKDSRIIKAFGKAIKTVGDSLSDLFGGSGNDADALGGDINRVSQRFNSLKDILSGLGTFFSTVWDGIADAASAAIEFLGDAFGSLGEAVAGAMSEGDFDRALDIVNTALFGGIVGLFWKFLQDGASIDLTGGLMTKLGETFEALTGVLEAMQTQIKAEAIFKIAKAVTLLAFSLLVLSLIDSNDLTKALGAMTVAFIELGAMMFALSKIAADPQTVGQIFALSFALIALSVSLIFMAIAAWMFSRLNPGELAKGLIGIGVSLGGLALALKPIAAATKPMAGAAIVILALAFSMIILAIATWMFQRMEWSELARGLVGVAAGLTGIFLAMRYIPANAGAKAPSLLALGFSLQAVAAAVAKMSELSWGEMAKGLVGLGFALGGMIAVANQMKGSLAGIGAIAVMAIALIVLSVALKAFGSMSWGDIGKGIVAIGGLLLVLGALAFFGAPAIPFMALLGLALIPLSFGLGLLANVLKNFASLGWGEIIGAILKLAFALILLAGISVILTPFLPFLALLGGALVIFGLGVLLAGAGIFFLARGLEILAETGSDAVGTLGDVLKEIIQLIPELAILIAEGFMEFFNVVAENAPKMVEGLVKIIRSIIDAIIELAPEWREAFVVLITEGLQAIRELVPEFIETGISILESFLRGIGEGIPRICKAAYTIVEGFIDCIKENPAISGGWAMVKDVVEGIREKVGNVVSAAVNIVKRFIAAIVNGARNAIGAGAGAVGNLVTGIMGAIGRLIGSGASAIGKMITGIRNKAGELLGEGASAVGKLATGIALFAWRLITEGAALGGELIRGLVNAIAGGLSAVIGAISDLARSAVQKAKDLFGIDSPSKVFREIGEYIIDGLVIGINDNQSVGKEVDSLGNKMISNFKSVADRVSSEFDDMIDLDPTITPVLDLSRIQQKAKDLDSMLASQAMLGDVSYNQAQSLASISNKEQTGNDSSDSDAGPRQIIFEQTVNASTPLSAGEVYRNTKSQIEMAKKELEVA